MKLFLCSHFSSVGSLIKEEIENKKVAFIPTASLREGYTGYVGSARKFMEEVLIDDNMVFDIDNLKGFLNDTSSFGFIAKENNKIIGFAYCYTLLRPDGKTMFYLHSIGMLPNYQDKGYGSKLLSFIKEYSKEIGCSEMFLITDKGNPRACHVYEKLGGKNDYKDEIVYVYDYEKGDK
jgi:ribosomal protein S18 acetylase RimI-like enzyme